MLSAGKVSDRPLIAAHSKKIYGFSFQEGDARGKWAKTGLGIFFHAQI